MGEDRSIGEKRGKGAELLGRLLHLIGRGEKEKGVLFSQDLESLRRKKGGKKKPTL